LPAVGGNSMTTGGAPREDVDDPTQALAAMKVTVKAKKCPVCGQLFETVWYLTQHKKRENHYKTGEKRGRKRKETAV
jgi:ribosomal protein S27AE